MDDPTVHSEVSLEERRGTPRRSKSRPMSLSFDEAVLSGQSRDISDSSVFFLAEGEMRLSVRFTDEEGGETARVGRLIRYQRMPDAGSGWAIEFDD